MQKEMLRSLRTLKATPAIVNRALKDKPIYKQQTCWYDRKQKYTVFESLHRCAYYLRCQYLHGIVKVAVFTPWMIQQGNDYPAFEIYLNVEGDTYITRYFDNEGVEKWSDSMIQNLSAAQYDPEVFGKYQASYYSYESACDKKAWINADGRETIQRELKIKKPVFDAIQEWQQACKDKKRDEADARAFKPWDDQLSLVPPVPKRFVNWAFKENTEHYIFYTAGEKTGWCSRCKKEVPLIKQRHKKPGTCPNCKHDIVFMAKGKMSRYLQTPVARSQIIQPIDGGYVIQVIETQRKYFHSYSYRKLDIFEPELRWDVLYKIICHDGKLIGYSEGWYKQRVYRWIPDGWAIHADLGRLYRKNAEAIEEMFPHSAAGILVKNELDIPFCSYMSEEKEYPVLESLVKIGLYDIVKHILCTGQYFMRTGRYLGDFNPLAHAEAAKALEIDNARLKRLMALGGSVTAWEWLKLEKRQNTAYKTDMLRFFINADIQEYELMVPNVEMSYEKMWHYLEKQQQLTGETVKQLITTWKDYLNMAEKNKLNIKLEQVYKPADLKKAHANMILLANKAEIEKEAKPIRRRFKKVDRNLSEIKKYEYTADGYSIVVPQKIEDIVLEGRTLQHCIHRCDYYFERINTKESYILFLRKASAPEVPWYTLEVEPGGNIRQKRTTGDNQNADLQEAMPFLKKWQRHIRKIMNAEEKKLAETADRKRKANYKDIRTNKKLVWHGKHQGELLADVLEADFMAAI